MNNIAYDLMAIDERYRAKDSKGIPCTITKTASLVRYGMVAVEYGEGLMLNKRYDFFTLS